MSLDKSFRASNSRSSNFGIYRCRQIFGKKLFFSTKGKQLLTRHDKLLLDIDLCARILRLLSVDSWIADPKGTAVSSSDNHHNFALLPVADHDNGPWISYNRATHLQRADRDPHCSSIVLLIMRSSRRRFDYPLSFLRMLCPQMRSSLRHSRQVHHKTQPDHIQRLGCQRGLRLCSIRSGTSWRHLRSGIGFVHKTPTQAQHQLNGETLPFGLIIRTRPDLSSLITSYWSC